MTDKQLDVDADILVKRGILGSGQGDILGNILSSGPGHKGELLGDVLGVTGGDHGYSHGRQYAHGHEYGHYYEDELVDAAADIEVDDLAIKRGYYDPDELMAEIEAEAEINADGIIYGKRFYRHEGGDLDIAADLDVDVDAVHHGHRYHERSGLLNNQNGVKGAVDVCCPDYFDVSRLTSRLSARLPTTPLASGTLATNTSIITSTTMV